MTNKDFHIDPDRLREAIRYLRARRRARLAASSAVATEGATVGADTSAVTTADEALSSAAAAQHKGTSTAFAEVP